MLTLDAIDMDSLTTAMDGPEYGEIRWWINPADGRIDMSTDDVGDDAPSDEELDESGWIPIDPVGSPEGFAIMEDFVGTLSDDRQRDALVRALGQRKPFRHFKDTLYGYRDLPDRWHLFHDERMRQLAIEWLVRRGLVDATEAAEAVEAADASRPAEEAAARGDEGAAVGPKVRVHNFSVSLDGYATGAGQSREAPFGHAGERLHEWMFDTAFWRPGGSGGVDDAFARQRGPLDRADPGVGAEIMGSGMFGYPGWQADPAWAGPWGTNPPFHVPVFVLTHHVRPPLELEGGTTFHFLDATPSEALEAAREVADGRDVRIGGGPGVVREFLAEGLIDHLHVVVVPILLGRGVRLWDGLEGLEQEYDVESTSSPSGVVHLTFTRRAG